MGGTREASPTGHVDETASICIASGRSDSSATAENGAKIANAEMSESAKAEREQFTKNKALLRLRQQERKWQVDQLPVLRYISTMVEDVVLILLNPGQNTAVQA